MIQTTFQNKLEDLKAYAEYMAGQTEQGKSIGREAYGHILTTNIAVSSLFAFFLVLMADIRNVVAEILVLIGLFVFFTVPFLLWARFRPRYYLAKQSYLAAQRNLSPKDLEKLKLPRKLTADDEWIEISTPLSYRRCNWSCIEKIGLTPDFIFIHEGGCPIVYIPRRSFPSEQAFQEFGQTLVKLRAEREAQMSGQLAA